MAFTLIGIGTRYYGTRWLPDGTHTTTKWVVFFFVPVVPLGSFRVLEESHPHGWGQPHSVQKAPFDIAMVLKTYAWVIGTAVALFLLSQIDRISM